MIINNITGRYLNNTGKLYRNSNVKSYGFTFNCPLSKDTVSFKSSLFTKDKFGRYYQEKSLNRDNSYRIIYYEDINGQIKSDGKRPYAPYHIEFEKPVDIFSASDICNDYLYNCEICYMKDKNQMNDFKKFILHTGVFKDEKIKSMIDAMNCTLVLELENNRVLKMTDHAPFAAGREFEPSFDIPLFSDVYTYKNYYMFIQEKADTDDVDDEALESVINRIKEAGYTPFDIIGDPSQVGWSEIMQDYMLIDSECARKK